MATLTLRNAARITLLAGTGGTIAYQISQHNTTTSSFPRTAHAESPSPPATHQMLPWKGFTELKLETSETVNHNVKRLTFSLPSGDTISGLSPITSLLTQHTPPGSFLPVFRPYTPISSGTEPGRITFLVKKYADGKGSGKMHSLAPGDTMKFKPLHEFEYTPNQFESVLFVAGGTGITPIYQLTNAILANPDDKTAITLVYANNTEADILLRSEFETLEKKFPGRFRKLFAVSRSSNSEDQCGLEKGYVTKEMIGKVWPGKRPGQKVLVSGPPAMTEAVAGAKGGFGWTQGSVGGVLKELGYEKDDVHKF